MSLRLEKVCYTYDRNSHEQSDALVDVSLEIPRGQFLGIIGHTGSGKSTLIQHFNGLTRPTSGRVLFHGEDIWAKDYNRKQLRFKVGLVFQYPEYQLFENDVLTDVCYGPKNQGLSKSECIERAIEALKLTGVDEKYYGVSPFELSGGQKRRVAIAGILAMRPEILVLDEPTAGLDPEGKRELLDQLSLLHKEQGISICLVSHSMEDVAEYAQRLIVMDGGRKVYDDAPGHVFEHVEELRGMGLDVPQVNAILHRLAEKGMKIDTKAITVRDAADSIMKAIAVANR